MSYTHTYVILDVSNAAYDEIKRKLEAADYSHAFHEDREYGIVIDMHGIALAKPKGEDNDRPKNTRRRS